jgi:hypothetical protein
VGWKAVAAREVRRKEIWKKGSLMKSDRECEGSSNQSSVSQETFDGTGLLALSGIESLGPLMPTDEAVIRAIATTGADAESKFTEDEKAEKTKKWARRESAKQRQLERCIEKKKVEVIRQSLEVGDESLSLESNRIFRDEDRERFLTKYQEVLVRERPRPYRCSWLFRDHVLFRFWREPGKGSAPRLSPPEWDLGRRTKAEYLQLLNEWMDAREPLIAEWFRIPRTRNHGDRTTAEAKRYEVDQRKRYEWAVLRFCFGKSMKDIAAPTASNPDSVKRAIRKVLEECGLPVDPLPTSVLNKYPH